jgi:large subunit ribosomal protein L19
MAAAASTVIRSLAGTVPGSQMHRDDQLNFDRPTTTTSRNQPGQGGAPHAILSLDKPARRDRPMADGKETTMQSQLMAAVEQATMKTTIPKFEIGDTVDVHVRILEGDKERIQIFNGVVIARSGSGSRELFTVRRIVQGEGVERKFPLHSPRIADIVVKRSGKVRRAKLYYLRQRSGKAVRLKERFSSTAASSEAKAAKAERRAARAAKKAQSSA